MSNNNWRDPQPIKPTHQLEKSGGKITYSYNQLKRGAKKFKPKTLKTLLLIIVAIVLFFGIIGLGILAWISKDLPSPDGVIKRNLTVSTKIYDRKGETILYNIHGNIKRTVTTLDQVPEFTKQAVLAAEDRNFYSHGGFSITGIIRSALLNVFTGSRVGGSTLTQQFVKNAILTNEKTYTRKIKELLISYQIERSFTKDQIFNMYLNEIPYGSVIYGIEAASQSFFNKSVRDLTLAESAIIAAIPNRPTYYSPYGNNKDKLLIRQRYILDSMAEMGYITKDQADEAKNEKISFKPLKDTIIAPHFVMYIKEILSEKYGEDFINQEGLSVYTTLDLEKQKIAEEAIKIGLEANAEKYGFTNASLVSLDPKTGQILAMVGSADFYNEKIDGQVNVSISPRQPGSSFKPIVYLASFLKGYTPNTIIYDTFTNFDTGTGKPYEPRNYHLNETGPVTLRKALAGSLNIAAVKITYLTGMDNILDLAGKLGYTTLTDKSRFGLSIVLGGAEVKLLEHVGAYSVFATDGVKHTISPILKIEDKNKKVIEEFKDKGQEVIDAETTRQINDILSDDSARSYIFGSGGKLTLPGRPVAAKTGTTNNYHDAWAVGYTPSLVAGVWVGNANNDAMKRGADGSIVAAPIWNYYMLEALKNTPIESFTKPSEVITGKPVLDGQITAGNEIKIDTMSGKLATQYTPQSTIKIVYDGKIHNILHYINKDDPRGPAPTNPESDPQYNNWEIGVKNWAQKNGLGSSEENQILPTEYDDIHLPEDQPKLTIISPTNNQTINDPNLKVTLSGTAKRGITKTEYYIDDVLINSGSGLLENFNLDLSDYENGYHTLTIKIKDDLQNTASKTINLNLLFSGVLPRADITSPQTNSKTNTFPIIIKGDYSNQERIKQVDFYFSKNGDANESIIGTSKPDGGSNFSISWKTKPEPGEYTISTYIFTQQNKKITGDKIKITIE